MTKLFIKPRIRIKPPLKARRYIPKPKKRTIVFRVICALLIASILIVVIDIRVRPIIKTAASNAVKNQLTVIINESVNSVLEKECIEYGTLVTLEKNKDGDIKAVTAKSQEINRFKALVSKTVSETIGSRENSQIGVPWGTLTGSSVLNGRGRKIKIKVTLFGYALTDIESAFEGAGINQTRHRIYITVSGNIGVYVGTYHVTEKVEIRVLVAETVIVGNVPESFFDIN